MSAPSAEPSVSVCVVVRDRTAQMLRCLEALLGQTVAPAEVVVVVDAASTEPVAEAIRERAAIAEVPVVVVVDAGNVAARRACAVGRASGDVVAWTDSDCRPERTWLERGLAPFADPEVGIVQGRTKPAPAPAPAGNRGRWRASQQIDGFSGLFETCNVLVRRAAYDRTPGFQEAIGFWGEDTALGWQVVSAGWATAFAADAVVEHATSYPGFLWFLQRTRHYVQWGAILRCSPLAAGELCHSRWFLRARDRHIALATASLLAAPAFPIALVGVLPWLRLRRPLTWSPGDVSYSCQLLLHDAVSFGWIVYGSLRGRRPML